MNKNIVITLLTVLLITTSCFLINELFKNKEEKKRNVLSENLSEYELWLLDDKKIRLKHGTAEWFEKLEETQRKILSEDTEATIIISKKPNSLPVVDAIVDYRILSKFSTSDGFGFMSRTDFEPMSTIY